MTREHPAVVVQDLLDVAARRREAALDFLRLLVEHESPTEEKAHTDAVAVLLTQRLVSQGFDVDRDRQDRFGDHIVARRPGAAGAPTVLLVGHFDTVYPLGTLASMPFAVRGEHVVGPGVLDMKGGLVVCLEAVATLDAAGLASPSLVAIMNSDEEPGSPTSRRLIERLARGSADAALVFEPGVPGKSVTTGRKGVGIFNVHVSGHSAHAGAEPERGASAVHQLAHTIVGMLGEAHPDVGTTINVGSVHGGRLPYVVADAATATVDVRAPTRDEAERVLTAFARIEADTTIPRTSVRIEGSFHRPPFVSSEQDELWLLARAAGRAAGLEPIRHTTGGASDANNIAALGISTLDGLGPDGTGAHGPDERFVLDTFHRKVAMSAAILASLADEQVARDLLRTP